MKRNKSARRAVVSADDTGVVSHAGVGLLREMAEETGLAGGVTSALLDPYNGIPVHAPGKIFTDVTVAVTDGADCISGISVLADREELFGPVASMSTTWWVLDRVDSEHLGRVRAAREWAWAAPDRIWARQELRLDFDATITIARSEKQNAAATWKRTLGSPPVVCFA